MRLESLLNNKSKNKDAQILLNNGKTTAIIKTTVAEAISNNNISSNKEEQNTNTKENRNYTLEKPCVLGIRVILE